MKVCPVCGSEYGDDAAFCSRDRSPLRLTAAAAAQGLIGQLIGDRYQVESRLGSGGMGEVYLATHVMMGRRCALKVMSESLSKDADAVSRFNREATNASRISHPNVCAVYDFGLTPDGLVYLAMEYVDGKTLTSLSEETGPMPVREAAVLMTQCAAGLTAAHELGIVHRDLKPDNIMVVSRKEGSTVKLVDFGIAKAAAGEPSQRVTKTGLVVGTPEYMSPEQVSGDALDGRSDQYGLALVFYRLITGRLPFDGASMQETLVKRLTDPPRPLAMARPDGRFPSGLQEVMDRALSRQPQNRYPTVTAFVEAINALDGNDAVATQRIDVEPTPWVGELPPTRRLAATVPRRRSMATFAAAGIVVVGAATWGVLKLAGAPAVSAPPDSMPSSTDSTASIIPTTTASNPDTTTPPPPATPPVVKQLAATPKLDAAPADTSRTVAEDATDTTLALPSPEQLDSPRLRPAARRRATVILESEAQPRWKRAQAAAFLASDLISAKRFPLALRMYERADSLYPTAHYKSMISQVRDRTPQ